MDSAGRVVPAPVVDPLAVGRAFVMQYYEILYNMPEHLFRFYQEISKIGRVNQDGVMRDFSTLQGIREELKTLSCGDFKSAEITSYDTQESYNGGFLLVVTGFFTLNERLKKNFTQTFFLAPQENGYFVLNDILRFANEPEAIDGEDSDRISPITGIQGSEQVACVPVNDVCEENVLVPEVVNEEVSDLELTCKEVVGDSLKFPDPDYGPKKSYASVVAKDKSGVTASSSLSPKQIPKEQEHQASSDPSPEQILKDQDHQASSDPSPVIESDAVPEVVDATENGHNQGFEAVAEGTSIHVKHLPTNATIDILENAFKQFGAISNGGIQVVHQRGLGYPYGFVEFKEADAAQKAIEASPLRICGQKAFVEEKRSTARGNNRGSGNGYGNRNVGGGGNEYGNRNVGGKGGGSYGYGNNYRRGGGGGGRSFNRRGNEYVASFNNSY
ncbi:putative G3BP-like protein isoform X2 [Eutrema salsugineum]|uniref:putative G3BP-like protein isoform X2 n=1 Tax=Eutrema salsugineum TaxID=72664 RepID=UPI000CED3AD3|nr:putative G3BP-like protein isoform X2 [Eutrema salsugineum]